MTAPRLVNTATLSCLLAAGALCSAGGCVLPSTPTQTVEVTVRRADTNQPIQNAMIEVTRGAHRGSWGVPYGPPEYQCAYTDEHGQASICVAALPFSVSGIRSSVTASATGFKSIGCDVFREDPHDRNPLVRDGKLNVALTPRTKWHWRKEGELPDLSTFVVERERPRMDPKDRPKYVPHKG